MRRAVDPELFSVAISAIDNTHRHPVAGTYGCLCLEGVFERREPSFDGASHGQPAARGMWPMTPARAAPWSARSTDCAERPRPPSEAGAWGSPPKCALHPLVPESVVAMKLTARGQTLHVYSPPADTDTGSLDGGRQSCSLHAWTVTVPWIFCRWRLPRANVATSRTVPW